LKPCFLVVLSTVLSACFTISASGRLPLTPTRPLEIEKYYKVESSYSASKEEVTWERKDYNIKDIELESELGVIKITYFQRKKKSDNLILVFPILGGRNTIENYFARYFCESGYDAAVIHRNNDFKDHTRFYELEEIFRVGLVRDRIGLDYFEREHGKKRFGSFGISRGAINVAMVAGVDSRLKYNVLALGGSDMVSIFRDTDQHGIRKYRNNVMNHFGIDKKEFVDVLREKIETDPDNLAQYVDPKNTMLILAMFDTTVPFKYGLKLREQLNRPKTVFIMAGHLTALLFTQFGKIIRPSAELSAFPLDYIETKALTFYDRSFGKKRVRFSRILTEVLSFPFEVAGAIASPLF